MFYIIVGTFIVVTTAHTRQTLAFLSLILDTRSTPRDRNVSLSNVLILEPENTVPETPDNERVPKGGGVSYVRGPEESKPVCTFRGSKYSTEYKHANNMQAIRLEVKANLLGLIF